MRQREGFRGALVALMLLLPAAARADIVGDWNARAQAALVGERVAGTAFSRALAIMHIAMFDAANAAGRRYTPFLSAAPEAPGASPEAAIHAAARHVLAELFPKQKAAIDAAYEAAVAALPEGPAKTAGIAAGRQAAAAILAERKNDGFHGPNTYRPATRPGAYIPTTLPVMSHVKDIKPLALARVDQFRPGPPPALDSALWARDYDETKRLGGAGSTERTAWQTETARFWVISGAEAWNQATRALVSAKSLPLLESARLYAQVNIALFDAQLAVFDAKYRYEFWRPITAIRNGDIDGNDATARDAEWRPLIDTPPHPEYSCAHCVSDGAAGAVLRSVFGDGPVPEFTLRYAAMPGVTRSYTSIQQLEDEVAMARIWGGVHFRNSNEVGNALGKKGGACDGYDIAPAAVRASTKAWRASKSAPALSPHGRCFSAGRRARSAPLRRERRARGRDQPRSRNNRCCCLFHSRFFSVSRLSYFFLPRARPSSTLAMPRGLK